MKFQIREVSLERRELPQKLESLRNEWISSVLTNFSVPNFMIEKALSSSEMTSQGWRNYLYDNFGLQVIFILPTQSIQISKTNFENRVQATVGEWFKPDVEYREGEIGKCILHLNYWSA